MKFKLVFILFLSFFSSYVLAQDRVNHENPSVVGHSLRMMKTAGFWISRHPSPDVVIMSPDAIDQFNASLRHDKKLTRNIFAIIQDLKTKTVLEGLEKTWGDIKRKNYYTSTGARDNGPFLEDIKSNMNIGSAATGMALRYGLVVHYASVRFLPTMEGLYDKKGDYDFDQLQNSALDTGTPVAVVHASRDGLWYYVMTEISDGWVEAGNIALGNVDQVRKFARPKDFAVVIRPKADIFLNRSMTDYYDYVRMGMHLPLSGVDAGRVTVNVPVMGADGALAIKNGYMNAEDVHRGFLPFSARNIYKQALMMLNEPYGWGDMYGEQDCSRFVQMVFATMGIALPRDSKTQAQVSNSAVVFDEKSKDAAKISVLAKASTANTLLAMKGHIMLYLGSINGKPYVIHDTTVNKLDRVIISDLSLGQGSQKGSLLRRLTRVVTIE